MMNTYDAYSNKTLTLQEFQQVVAYLESYFVRRWFAEISTRSLGKLFNTLYSQVIGKEEGDNFVEKLHAVLTEFTGTQRWPDDEEFSQGIINTPIYSNNNQPRVQLVLETIERNSTREHVDTSNLSIEHVMPQNLRTEWKEMIGRENADKIHKQWLHTLGNLTLTAYNREISNKPFQEKLQFIRKSNLTLNQYFHDLNQWNGEKIKKRAEFLADKAVGIWSR
jgi:hypothetical protein